MILDLTNLAPASIDRILNAVHKECVNNSILLKEDVKRYSEGEVKEEFNGWIKAGQDILNQIHEYKYPLLRKKTS